MSSASPRMHVVVLTSNRTRELCRCVDTALSRMGPLDVLTVLDDSVQECAHQNLAALRAMAKGPTAVSHVAAEGAHASVANAMDRSCLGWQKKTASRDIAPLRNLALLLTATVAARTTVFIDDDVTGFDLSRTHAMLEREPEAGGVIAGAEIGGWTEMDTLTRLNDAMEQSQTMGCPKACDAERLFRVNGRVHAQAGVECRWVSAGYMAFRVPALRFLAFPPGYNEDWLWCMLQRFEAGTRVVGLDQLVLHEPPTLRRPSAVNIRFELLGDLIFDAFLECMDSWTKNGTSVLDHMGRHRPSQSLLPGTRIRETLEMAVEAAKAGRLPAELEEHGLSVLRGMQEQGDMEIDGASIISAWCREAGFRQRVFGRTLENGEVLASLRRVMHAGRL